MRFIIKKIKKDGTRLGKLITEHGIIQTPFFMPDATRGFIKTLNFLELKKTGIRAIVVNTYHLFLQPGIDIIKKIGNIHNFIKWEGPILSDSGGFQIFSLIHKNPKSGKITDDAAFFRSPLNGELNKITPEDSIKIQFDLGVDMMVCLDDCPPNTYSEEEIRKSVLRTIKWAERCRNEYWKQIKLRKFNNKNRPLLFAVIQGGVNINLRKHCIKELIKIGESDNYGSWDGFGFGAMPINEKGEFLYELLKKTALFIPQNYIRFALGIGTPENIKKCVKAGWDMFDCVIPTREGRHGKIFRKENRFKYKTINITNSKFKKIFYPINKNSKFEELKKNNLAYLHYLFKNKESQGQRLASLNNLEFYSNLMKDFR